MYVEMRNIYKQYGNFRASDNVSFGIEKGKLAALLGPSGSGKTTLLRMIAGLENPNAGDIFIDGKRVNDIPAAKRGIGFVFQSYALFRYMTVFDNIAFGLEIAKMPKKQIKERVFELLELTGLSGLENRYPNQLSGGQRQRVAFARALAPNPQVLLLDEPFAAIDAKVRSELRLWLKEMVSKLGITSIFVTHDQDEAVEVADEILITNHGKIEQMGSPLEIYKSPKTPFVAQFVGRSSIVENYESLKGFEKIEKYYIIARKIVAILTSQNNICFEEVYLSQRNSEQKYFKTGICKIFDSYENYSIRQWHKVIPIFSVFDYIPNLIDGIVNGKANSLLELLPEDNKMVNRISIKNVQDLCTALEVSYHLDDRRKRERYTY